MAMRSSGRGLLVVSGTIVLTAQVLAQAPAAASAKTWADRTQEIEAYLRSADVVSMEDVSVGVTHPRRAQLAPGGPVSEIAWKALKPGRYQGYWESYKSEIAAYELDKLLALGMVPPTVEKHIKGEVGAAVMWVTPTQSFFSWAAFPVRKA